MCVIRMLWWWFLLALVGVGMVVAGVVIVLVVGVLGYVVAEGLS